MAIFRNKARTAESYVAGFGASGGLMAGGMVAFLLLVGIVTYNAWPQTDGIFSGDGAEVGTLIGGGTAAGGAGGLGAVLTQTANAALPGGTGAGPGGGGGDGNGGGSNGVGGGGGGSSPGGSSPGGGSPGGGGGGNGGGGDGGSTPTSPSSPTDPVRDTVSNLGNQVDDTTTGLGNTVNDATGTNLGDAVTGVGNTVNGTLQGLTGHK